MSFIKKIFSKKEQKESAVGNSIASYTVGNPVWTPRDYATFADEGYLKNVITYRCIKEIARGAASVPWVLRRGSGKDTKEIEKHDLLKLLQKPNPLEAGASFFEGFFSFRIIAGNAYIEANRGLTGKNKPVELWNLRPDRMRIIPGKTGLPAAYEHEVNGIKKRFEVNPINGQSNILHWKDFNPLNDWYGASPIEAASFSIDQHNTAGAHNQALLQNGARPSGALLVKDALSETDAARVMQILTDRHGSPANAGKPMLLNGDASWLDMSVSPKEMDFTESTAQVARNICFAFGVPPQLLGIPGDSTYNNLVEARQALWENTIIPTLDSAIDALNSWLVPMFEEGLSLSYDLDQVAALTLKRYKHREAVIKEYDSGVISINEARVALGYDERLDGDTLKTSGGLNLFSDSKKRELKALNNIDVTSISSEIEDPKVLSQINGLVSGLLAEIISRLGKSEIQRIGRRINFENNEKVKNFIANHTANLISQINKTTKTAIRFEIAEAIQNGEKVSQISDRIQAVFDDAEGRRASIIALTESTKAAGFSSNEAMKQSGIQKKEWLATADGATRDTHSFLDGQTVDIEGRFRTTTGAEADYPGGFGLPEEDINCRCAVTAKIDDKSLKTEDRKKLWLDMEEKRKTVEGEISSIFKKVFNIQRQVTIKRLIEITS